MTAQSSDGARSRRHQMEWALLANEQAVVASIVMFCGAIFGVAGIFKNWQFAASVIPTSFIIFVIEWPRGSRLDGKKTVERQFQSYLTALIRVITPLKNYFVRAALMTIFSIPCFFLLPTFMGGLSLLVSGIIYIMAAINKEEWKPVKKDNRTKENSFPSPPGPPPIPPPRNLEPPQGFLVRETNDTSRF